MFSEPIVGEKRTELINEIMMLRAQGWSLRRVAKKLGISYETVRILEQEGLASSVARIDQKYVDEVRAKQLAKCDELYDILSNNIVTVKGEGDDAVTTADPESIRAYMKVMEREAKIVGSDAPERKEIERKKVKDFASDAARKAAFDDIKKKYGVSQDVPTSDAINEPPPTEPQ